MDNNILEAIDKTIKTGVERRGFFIKSLDSKSLGYAGKELFNSKTVFILTGFCIRDTLTGETDGPIGALSIASALERLGKKAVIISDIYSKKILEAGIKAGNINAKLEIVPYKNPEIISETLLNKYNPTHLIAIERPGKANDKCYYSMRGEDLRDLIPNTDILFEEAVKRKITTIAIGDGGNELGMGGLAFLETINCKENSIWARSIADYQILCGVSNWGGYGLVAVLSIMSGQALLHDRNSEIKLLEEIVSCGSVDGYTKKKELTVDGLSLEENLAILEKLNNIVEKGIELDSVEIAT